MASDTSKGKIAPGESEETHINKNEDEIRQKIEQCKKNLASLTAELGIMTGTTMSQKDTTNGKEEMAPPVDKAGYLWKWQDRQIGWGGTKWDLRFVRLDGAGGQLMYYRYHTTAMSEPRYMLSLRGCAVKDDGEKPQKKSQGYYYVFSIYHKNEKLKKEEDESHIIPLLRFSTESLAEKNQWIHLISEACAYSDAMHAAALPLPKDVPLPPAAIPRPTGGMVYSKSFTKPDPTPGTLSPIYFGENYRRKARNAKAAKSNPRQVAGYPPSRPMHQSAEPSYLSFDSHEQNYRGFLNLAAIILLVSNFRLIFDSFKKHGVVLLANVKSIKYDEYKSAPLAEYPFLTGELLLHAFVLIAVAIEKSLGHGTVSERTGTSLHVINCTATLAIPTVIVWRFMEHPVAGCVFLTQAVISFAKLVSYAHANSDYRACREDSAMATAPLVHDVEEREGSISYPNNVTLKNVYYFYYAPTLTYQIAFPRNRRVRWWYVMGLLLRIAAAAAFLALLFAQTITPQLDRIQRLSEEGTLTNRALAEILLKLSIPNTYCWLVFFYLYFHLLLNLCAELLRFGDRVFYKDWWNSSEVSAYWRLWNLPVHYWLIRHLYFPVIRSGVSKNMAMLSVFFLSAVLHELLISVPFHMIRPWSFLGMMGQVPLVAITKRLEKKFPGSSIGNIIFWVSFCMVGQPSAIIFYAIDYWKLGANANSSPISTCTGIECEL